MWWCGVFYFLSKYVELLGYKGRVGGDMGLLEAGDLVRMSERGEMGKGDEDACMTSGRSRN